MALLSNSLRRLPHATPFASPDAEQHESAASATIRFISRFTPWSMTRATTRQRIARSDRTALRPQVQAQIRSHNTSLKSSRWHGRTPVPRRCVRSRTQCCPPQQNEHAKPASPFNMGRRIMAERRRHRRERRREHRPPARADANNQIDARCDEPLRTFVRALARQAARELFEAQLKRHSAEIH